MSFDYPDAEEPEGLARIRAQLTERDRINAFVKVFGRDSNNNDELDEFIETYTLELYNNQIDEEPGFEPRL